MNTLFEKWRPSQTPKFVKYEETLVEEQTKVQPKNPQEIVYTSGLCVCIVEFHRYTYNVVTGERKIDVYVNGVWNKSLNESLSSKHAEIVLPEISVDNIDKPVCILINDEVESAGSTEVSFVYSNLSRNSSESSASSTPQTEGQTFGRESVSMDTWRQYDTTNAVVPCMILPLPLGKLYDASLVEMEYTRILNSLNVPTEKTSAQPASWSQRILTYVVGTESATNAQHTGMEQSIVDTNTPSVDEYESISSFSDVSIGDFDRIGVPVGAPGEDAAGAADVVPMLTKLLTNTKIEQIKVCMSNCEFTISVSLFIISPQLNSDEYLSELLRQVQHDILQIDSTADTDDIRLLQQQFALIYQLHRNNDGTNLPSSSMANADVYERPLSPVPMFQIKSRPSSALTAFSFIQRRARHAMEHVLKKGLHNLPRCVRVRSTQNKTETPPHITVQDVSMTKLQMVREGFHVCCLLPENIQRMLARPGCTKRVTFEDRFVNDAAVKHQEDIVRLLFADTQRSIGALETNVMLAFSSILVLEATFDLSKDMHTVSKTIAKLFDKNCLTQCHFLMSAALSLLDELFHSTGTTTVRNEKDPVFATPTGRAALMCILCIPSVQSKLLNMQRSSTFSVSVATTWEPDDIASVKGFVSKARVFLGKATLPIHPTVWPLLPLQTLLCFSSPLYHMTYANRQTTHKAPPVSLDIQHLTHKFASVDIIHSNTEKPMSNTEDTKLFEAHTQLPNNLQTIAALKSMVRTCRVAFPALFQADDQKVDDNKLFAKLWSDIVKQRPGTWRYVHANRDRFVAQDDNIKNVKELLLLLEHVERHKINRVRVPRSPVCLLDSRQRAEFLNSMWTSRCLQRKSTPFLYKSTDSTPNTVLRNNVVGTKSKQIGHSDWFEDKDAQCTFRTSVGKALSFGATSFCNPAFAETPVDLSLFATVCQHYIQAQQGDVGQDLSKWTILPSEECVGVFGNPFDIQVTLVTAETDASGIAKRVVASTSNAQSIQTSVTVCTGDNVQDFVWNVDRMFQAMCLMQTHRSAEHEVNQPFCIKIDPCHVGVVNATRQGMEEGDDPDGQGSQTGEEGDVGVEQNNVNLRLFVAATVANVILMQTIGDYPSRLKLQFAEHDIPDIIKRIQKAAPTFTVNGTVCLISLSELASALLGMLLPK